MYFGLYFIFTGDCRRLVGHQALNTRGYRYKLRSV